MSVRRVGPTIQMPEGVSLPSKEFPRELLLGIQNSALVSRDVETVFANSPEVGTMTFEALTVRYLRKASRVWISHVSPKGDVPVFHPSLLDD